MDSIAQKMNPARYPNMPGAVGAIIGYVLGEPSFTNPAIEWAAIDSGGHVVAIAKGKLHVIGAWESVLAVWQELLDKAGLTSAERDEAQAKFRFKFGVV